MSSSPDLTSQETNGAVPSVGTLSPPPSPKTIDSKHQIDGAYIPITGPITNARQLIRGRNVARGAIESFETLASYTAHLRKLTLAELHRHAVEDARVVPIDDSERLIRRL
jgi:hypothetical protein